MHGANEPREAPARLRAKRANRSTWCIPALALAMRLIWAIESGSGRKRREAFAAGIRADRPFRIDAPAWRRPRLAAGQHCAFGV